MTKCKRILLVDRDEELLRDLSEHCRAIGLEVFTAHEGASAAQSLEKNSPDLVCVDDEMPGGDGLTLCEMVVASPDDVSCPVVVLSRRMEPARKRAAQEMCVYFLHKRPNLWRYLEPVIYELVDLQPVSSRTNDQGRGLSGCFT